MADEAQTIRSINWREVFPFTNLFRAFRVAVHPSKLLLALAALLLIYAGGRALDAVWPDRYSAAPAEFAASGAGADMARAMEIEDTLQRAARGDYSSGGLRTPLVRSANHPKGIFINFFEFEARQISQLTQGVLRNDWFTPGRGVFYSIFYLIADGPGRLVSNHPLYAVLFFAWFLIIWSVFGGAISRIAAVHVARDEKISVRQALRFSISKVLSFLFAPLIPLLIILVIGAVVSATGAVLLRIPYAGPILTGLVFFLALLAGFIITLVALGTVGGFNLMFPTVAVEGSDSFDAISRSFSYVFARPWRMLFYTMVAVAYGALTYLFVRLFIYVMLLATHFFVGWWLGNGSAAQTWNGTEGYAALWNPPVWQDLNYNVDYAHLKMSEKIAASEISFWVYLTIGLLGAFAISFYFSANTIIYYLMRREVDATELDDVYVEETEDEFGEPVTTTAATTPSATPTPVSASTTASAGETHDSGGARAYPVEGGSGTATAIGGTAGDTGNTNQAPGGGTANP
jgi:hypothetical protein